MNYIVPSTNPAVTFVKDDATKDQLVDAITSRIVEYSSSIPVGATSSMFFFIPRSVRVRVSK